MRPRSWSLLSVITASTLAASLAAGPPARAAQEAKRPPVKAQQEPARDPRGVEVLQRMTQTLQRLDRFEIQARTTTDLLVDNDMKVQRSAELEVVAERPNRLFAKVANDRRAYQLYYDGRTLTVFDPSTKYYATMRAPGTIRDLVVAAERRGIEMPLADFLGVASRDELLANATEIGYLGTSRIGGAETEHIAVRQPDVDWQVWVDKQTGLPRRYVITTKTDPTAPQFIAELDWSTAPRLTESQFTFRPPADARRIPFADEVGQQGRPPARGSRPAPAQPQQRGTTP